MLLQEPFYRLPQLQHWFCQYKGFEILTDTQGCSISLFSINQKWLHNIQSFLTSFLSANMLLSCLYCVAEPLRFYHQFLFCLCSFLSRLIMGSSTYIFSLSLSFASIHPSFESYSSLFNLTMIKERLLGVGML